MFLAALSWIDAASLYLTINPIIHVIWITPRDVFQSEINLCQFWTCYIDSPEQVKVLIGQVHKKYLFVFSKNHQIYKKGYRFGFFGGENNIAHYKKNIFETALQLFWNYPVVFHRKFLSIWMIRCKPFLFSLIKLALFCSHYIRRERVCQKKAFLD